MFSLLSPPAADPSPPAPKSPAAARETPLPGNVAWRCPAKSAGVATWFLSWLTALSANPRNLLLAALVVNSLAMPYRSRYHDSILYGFQVANRAEHQRFAGDLFLAFGSQDRFSLFSAVAAPLAHLVGVPLSFFVLYLAGLSAFFWALLRLLRALIPNPQIVALALIGLAVASPPIGGLGVFHVTENFLTPRLISSALTLFALERMLAGRVWSPLILLSTALAIHPLVAFGGCLVFVLYWLLRMVTRTFLLGLAVLVAAGATLLLVAPSIGVRIFGFLDPAWQTEIRLALPCLFTTEWEFGDWLEIMVSTAVLLASLRCLAWDTRQRNFLAAVVVTTALAAIGAMIASFLPYALLLQGQPFRAFWIVQTLRLPLSLLLCRKWWLAGDRLGRISAIALVGYLGAADFQFADGAAMLAAFAVMAILFWQSDVRSDRPTWVWLALAISGIVVLALRAISRETQILLEWRSITGLLDGDVYLRALVVVLDPILLFGLALAVLVMLSRATGLGRRFQFVALAIVLAVQLGCFAIQEVPSLRAKNQPRYGDIEFVRQFLQDQPDAGDNPVTVYWPTGHYEDIWFDLKCNSYFSLDQLVGNVFSRATAMEGRRRADLARAFEIDLVRQRQLLFNARRLRELEQVLHANADDRPPSIDDLLRLCADERVDYAILRQEFPGWHAGHNANWLIYDCRAIRSRLNAPAEELCRAQREFGPAPCDNCELGLQNETRGLKSCASRLSAPARQASPQDTNWPKGAQRSNSLRRPIASAEWPVRLNCGTKPSTWARTVFSATTPASIACGWK